MLATYFLSLRELFDFTLLFLRNKSTSLAIISESALLQFMQFIVIYSSFRFILPWLYCSFQKFTSRALWLFLIKFQCKTASSNLQISAAVSLKLSKSIVLIEIFMISFEILSKDRILVQFTAESVKETNYAFQEWKYAMFKALWYTKNSAKYDVYTNIKCTMFLSDKKFIKSITSNFTTKIRKLMSLISIRDIKNKIHNSDEYILMNDFIKETLLNDTSAIAFFQREVHLINNLKMKMLIDIDILSSKRIQINLNDKILQINSCQDIIIKINIITWKKANLKRIVRFQEKIIVSSHVFLKILVKIKDLSKNQDFIFKLKYD